MAVVHCKNALGELLCSTKGKNSSVLPLKEFILVDKEKMCKRCKAKLNLECKSALIANVEEFVNYTIERIHIESIVDVLKLMTNGDFAHTYKWWLSINTEERKHALGNWLK